MFDGMSGCILFDYIQNSEKRHCGKCGKVAIGTGFGIKKPGVGNPMFISCKMCGVGPGS